MAKAKFRGALPSTSLPFVGAVVLIGTLMAVINVSAQTVDPLSVVMYQGFNWDSSKNAPWYPKLQAAADDIAAAGITDVWFPPPSQSAAEQGYIPANLYDLDSSKYGTEAQLKAAIAAFREKGVRAMSDIVINHRNGSKQDDNGYWCIFEGGTDDARLDWAEWAVPPGDQPFPNCGTGNADTGESFPLAPDIDHTNPRVQKELSEWMNWLKSEIGFQGWRFDMVTGYSANISGLYLANTDPAFAVGELWPHNFNINRVDEHRQKIVSWIHDSGGRASAFDFTTKAALQWAIQNNDLSRMDLDGKPPGVIGVLPEKAVTFIDNHDTALPQNISGHFPYEKLLQGYAYILTHPGVPCIFYDHFMNANLKETITALVATRKKHGIKANSAIRIITAQSDLYMASIDEKVVMKIGARTNIGNLVPGSDLKLVTSGDGFAVWEKAA
uniref:Alpha-amylase n=1 Tax=Araucaria cunninghamii TaxID=56994 RepID=A0A0D6QR87_ARACU